MDVARLNRAAEPAPRRVARAVAAVLVLVLPAGVLFGLLTARISAESARAAGVLRAVEALRPIGPLAAALADARAGAVSDGADAAAVRSAAADVDAAVALPGGLPGGGERWADLRGRIALTVDRDAGGPAAAQEYGTLGGLTLALSTAVADTGGALDGGRAGTPYLAELAGSRLPALLGASAEYVDAVVAAQEVPDDPVPAGRAAAVRERVADLADQVELALDGAIDPGTGGLAEALLARTGDFRAALAGLVPSAGFAAPDRDTDAGAVRAQQREVVRTGAELQRAVLAELSGRAVERGTALTTELVLAVAAGVLALAAAGWLLWTGLAGPPRPVDRFDPDAPDDAERDVVMLDTRRLLDDPEQLVRVGRAVRRPRTPAHPQEPARDPA